MRMAAGRRPRPATGSSCIPTPGRSAFHGSTVPRPTLNVIDQWSGLAHKDLLDSATAPRFTPSWVPVAERRRLAAYLVLDR